MGTYSTISEKPVCSVHEDTGVWIQDIVVLCRYAIWVQPSLCVSVPGYVWSDTQAVHILIEIDCTSDDKLCVVDTLD